MPEYPDVTVYIERLRAFLCGHVIEKIRLANPFLLRSVDPPISEVEGREVQAFRRLGKRIVFELDGELFLVFHLMITGRFRWRKRGCPVPKKRGLAALDFEHGSLLLTEEGTKRRASLHAVSGESNLAEHDPGGLEVMTSTWASFDQAIRARNHTLKRMLTDPRILSGVGNAYSDEILHAAKMSPFKQSKHLSEAESQQLFDVVRTVLEAWTTRLRDEVGHGFPEKVTAFHPEMAVHGRHKKPCPACGESIQRIVYASNEANYCAKCQTGGKLLADRALSRLLRADWPKTIEELEAKKAKLRGR